MHVSRASQRNWAQPIRLTNEGNGRQMNRRKTPPIGKHTDSSKPSAASVAASREYEYRRAEVLATVSHELKNPLTAITGMSEPPLRPAQDQEEIDRGYLTRGVETIAKTPCPQNNQI